MSQESGDWKTIIQIHNETKLLVLLAEEVAPEHAFFWPTVVQQRDALDHIVRAQKAMLDPAPRPDGANADVYIAKQLDKALGHIYRAFFDAADWYSVVLREKIKEIAERYSRETILAVLPNYVADIEQFLDDVSHKIASFRKEKDIGNVGQGPGASPQNVNDSDDPIEAYRRVIDELAVCLKRLQAAVPELDKLEYPKR